MMTRFPSRFLLVATIALGFVTLDTSLAQAQGAAHGTFTGVVTRDTLGHPVGSAEIALPGLSLSMQTNARGEFKFSQVPAGHYLVTVRAIGFAPFADSIAIAGGQTLDGDLTLTPSVAQLDTLRTNAQRSTIETRSLEEFETRRKAHTTGTFISDSALRANENSHLSSLVSSLSGVRLVHGCQQGAATSVCLASARATTDGRPAFYATPAPCFVTVYIDGQKLFQAHELAGREPPDLAEMRASDYAGVEYYSSPSSAPAQYSTTGSDCGVLLLWSRKDRTNGTPF